jgi:hypothetical protein
MQTFGIKAEDQPMMEDGTLSLEWHHEWLQICKAQEEEEYNNISASDVII